MHRDESPPRTHTEFIGLLTHDVFHSEPDTQLFHTLILSSDEYPMSYYSHTNRQQIVGQGEKLWG